MKSKGPPLPPSPERADERRAAGHSTWLSFRERLYHGTERRHVRRTNPRPVLAPGRPPRPEGSSS